MEDQLRILNGKILFSQPNRLVDFDVCFRKDSIEMVPAFLQGDLNNPTEVFSITQPDVTSKLSDHGNALSEKDFGHCDFLECQTLDGKEILEGVYHIPTQHTGLNKKPKEPLPTLVFMHGGPYSGITDSFDVFDQLHGLIPSPLRAGFGVLILNYRGSSGRGERFSSYSRGGVGIFDEPDIVAMTQHAIDKDYVEKTHLIAGSWSQGGHLTYLSAVRNLDGVSKASSLVLVLPPGTA